MAKIPIDWKEWVTNGEVDRQRLDDLIEVSRQIGERMGHRVGIEVARQMGKTMRRRVVDELAKVALETEVDAAGRKG